MNSRKRKIKVEPPKADSEFEFDGNTTEHGNKKNKHLKGTKVNIKCELTIDSQDTSKLSNPRKRKLQAVQISTEKIKKESISDQSNDHTTKPKTTKVCKLNKSGSQNHKNEKTFPNKVKTEIKIEPKYESSSDESENECQSRQNYKKESKKIKSEIKIEVKYENPSDESENECQSRQNYKKQTKKIKTEIKTELKYENPSDKIENGYQSNAMQNKTKATVKPKMNNSNGNEIGWENYELLSEYENLNLNISRNIAELFDAGCTIPFIARYRKDVTDNMTPEVLRDVKHSYDKIITLKSRAQTVLNCVEKTGNLDGHLQKSILNARTIEEIEHIYAPFKPGNKRTLAERARALGLQEPALDILENYAEINLGQYIDKSNKELCTYDNVEKGIIHIIAHIISTDIKVLTFLRKAKMEVNFGLEVKKMSKRSAATKPGNSKQLDESKYENYFDFKMPVQFVKPHQVLAINRGESQKILSVKITVPEFILRKFTDFCKEKFVFSKSDITRKKILNESIQDSYTRLMQPLLVREIRAELKHSAEKASYDVFSTNLKQLLLSSPIKGRSIVGIDPGFSNGCKVALISPTGNVMSSNILYLHNNRTERDCKTLRDMLQQHNCSLVALGNGTACRETEVWLSDLIGRNYFSPLEVSYIIVNENGASIYSCSPEAKKEFPSLDPNIISAVSLARRVQEPLAEFVKVEPRHLGVGMYQHDLPKKKLEEALDEVVSECVSFVGVDLNTASQCLLRRIAGLSDKRATKIIEYRDSKGPFITRKDLTKITGIGPKIFEQCAGFLRVGPLTANEESAFYKNPSSNKLDCTIIHPESYELTTKLVKHFNLSLIDIGTTRFIDVIKEETAKTNMKGLSASFNTSEQTLRLILDALSKPLNYDLRNDCSKVPLFRKGVTNLSDLSIGTILTGRVTNVTHFGSFVDIGVGCNGLIHISKTRGQILQAGHTVEVRVVNIEIQRKRIGLELLKLI